jgi:hypothetical protein
VQIAARPGAGGEGLRDGVPEARHEAREIGVGSGKDLVLDVFDELPHQRVERLAGHAASDVSRQRLTDQPRIDRGGDGAIGSQDPAQLNLEAACKHCADRGQIVGGDPQWPLLEAWPMAQYASASTTDNW